MTLALVSAVLGALGALGAGALLLSDRFATSFIAWLLTITALLVALGALIGWWRQGPSSRRPTNTSMHNG